MFCDLAVGAGEMKVAILKVGGDLFVIETKLMKNGGFNAVVISIILHSKEAKDVGFSAAKLA